MRLRNAPTEAMKDWGYGHGYKDPQAEADGFVPNDGELWVRSATEPPLSREASEEMSRRFQAKLANWTWPGDETDEEIQQALRELG